MTRPAKDMLAAVRAAVARARSIVVLTGAGISAESGIPTFRGGMTALWKSFDPATLATPEAFARDPKTVTEWYDWRRLKCREAEPNAGHTALAALEQIVEDRGGNFTLLTQNVDRLHQRAGSKNVVELHGNIMEWRCAATNRMVDAPENAWPTCPPPSPHRSGTFCRPCVVWFGEMLPPEAVAAAEEAVHACDLFMSAGTSSVVYPAAGFVQLASRLGARTIEVNMDPTPISAHVDFALHGKAGDLLPQLIAP